MSDVRRVVVTGIDTIELRTEPPVELAPGEVRARSVTVRSP